MIQYYGKDIWKGNIAVEDALEKQITLKNAFDNFSDFIIPRKKHEKKKEKSRTYHKLLRERQLFISAFESGIFPMSYPIFSFINDPEKKIRHNFRVLR